MKDNLGRNINYLRISVTDRCNLRCRYCMPEEGIDKKEHMEMLTLEEIFEVVKVCTNLGTDKIRITGGEPLVRKGLTGLIEKITALESIKDIAVTTNGVLLKKLAHDLKRAGLKRINVSLDTMDAKKYEYITRGGNIKDVLEGIAEALKVGLLPIKINTVLTKGFNENEIGDFIKLTLKENIDVRFIELMPLGQAASFASEHYFPNTEVLERFKELEPVEAVDKSSPAKYYKLPGAKGRVGLINPISHKFCDNCNRIRLTADGKLKPCLHSNKEIDVRGILRDTQLDDKYSALRGAVAEAIQSKPEHHTLNDLCNEPIERDMYTIGG
ncbi:MAG: GTP 3',8-cyclase MoaA [Clostridiaceae bacterium]|nr:GTP 3',8-cyclase MoaA [Clostridiaceae bacterium]